jgi:hypothetical protein
LVSFDLYEAISTQQNLQNPDKCNNFEQNLNTDQSSRAQMYYHLDEWTNHIFFI